MKPINCPQPNCKGGMGIDKANANKPIPRRVSEKGELEKFLTCSICSHQEWMKVHLLT